MVGAPLTGRVVIIDDVITDGASKRESVDMIRAAGAEPAAVLIAMDRQERGGSDDNLSALSAVETFERDYGLPVIAIATLADLLKYLQAADNPAWAEYFVRVKWLDTVPENQAVIATKIPVELRPGDVLFFHCLTLHAATRNFTTAPKWSVVFTFRPADNAPISGTRSAESPELMLTPGA